MNKYQHIVYKTDVGLVMEKGEDTINHPPHYTATDIEPIDVIEAWQLGFHLGNAVKYIARHEHKGNSLEDLQKARWYLDRKIKQLESTGDK